MLVASVLYDGVELSLEGKMDTKLTFLTLVCRCLEQHLVQ